MICGYMSNGNLCRLDLADVARVALAGPWYLARASGHHRYFKRGRGHLRLHRWLLEVTDRLIHVDHINGDTADNRRANLRLCSSADGGKNKAKNRNSKSGSKGVSWCSFTGSWRAAITLGGKFKHLGRFPTKEQASAAYERAAEEYFKEWKRK